jgi:NAD(P)H dehydrogenase (quinone)
MTISVIGATGRVGSLVVQQLLEANEAVRVLVRDPDKAHQLFDEIGGDLDVHAVSLSERGALTAALKAARTVFVSMGSVGLEGNLQRVVLDTAARSSDLEQLVRLSVLNAGSTSLGINQRAHWNIDFAAETLDLPYTTIRPAIFCASVLAAAAEIRATRSWTGLAASGQVALIDHRDVANVAVRVLRDPATWGHHHELTGPRPVSWPDVVHLLSVELGEPVEFRTATEQALIQRLIDAGMAPGQAELLIAREWAVIAGENERTTDTVNRLTGAPPRTIEAFLHEHLDLFR